MAMNEKEWLRKSFPTRCDAFTKIYRDELELDRLYLRRLAGERLLLRDFERDLRLGEGERDRLPPALNWPRKRAGGDRLHDEGGGRRRGGLGRRAGLVSRGLIGSIN